jgi:uncharacterized repeat protein (TIGR01451 family)
MRYRGLACALAIGATALGMGSGGASAATSQGAVVSNGTVQLGVTRLGDLNYNCVGAGDAGCPAATPNGTSPVGVRFVALNTDATAAGCPCEGWGVADAGSGLTGYANESFGNAHLTPVSIVATATTVVVTTDVTDGAHPGYSLRVVHDYHPSPVSPNLYEVTVRITNTGTQNVTDLRYTRVMDWDIEPTPTREWVTIGNAMSSPYLRFDSDGGFASGNPLSPATFAQATPYRQSQAVCGGGYTGPCNFSNLGAGGVYPAVTSPTDHGALFDFGFGALATGATRVFQTYYGAAPSRAVALAAITAQGIGPYSLGEPNCGAAGATTGLCAGVAAFGGVTAGLPNTFTFGFLTSDVDLAVTSGGAPGAVVTGGQTAESFTVTNNGPDATAAAILTIPLPAGVDFVSAVPTQGSCTYSAPNVVCDLGALANGASVSVVLTTTLSQAGSHLLAATISAPGNDEAMGNNTVSVPLLASDVVAPVLAPVVPPVATPALAAPTLAEPFTVQVQFRIPVDCVLPCRAKAQLFLRGSTTRLGVRNGLSIDSAGRVRFFIPVDKVMLLTAADPVDAKGYRTALTRLEVSTRTAEGNWVATVKQGHISVSAARLASGRAPTATSTIF